MEQILNEQYQRKVEENRHYINTVGVVILTSTTQNISQCGKRERNDVINPENVIQNVIIDTFAMVLEEIAENIKKCHYFSKEVRKTEHLSLVNRFFNETSMSIEECFITFITMA